MKKYYIKKEKNISEKLSEEIVERIDYMAGMLYNYFFSARILVQKLGFDIPPRMKNEGSIREDTRCPIFYRNNGSRHYVANIVYREEKKNRHKKFAKDNKAEISLTSALHIDQS